jgi:hypothetical protein
MHRSPVHAVPRGGDHWPRARPRRRTRTLVFTLVLVIVAVGAAALFLANSGDDSVTTSKRPTAAPTRHAKVVSAPLSLEAGIEPWQLTTPISRETVLAGTADLTILGGLTASGNSVNGVYALDPATGALALEGSLATAVHDGAGAALGTSSFGQPCRQPAHRFRRWAGRRPTPTSPFGPRGRDRHGKESVRDLDHCVPGRRLRREYLSPGGPRYQGWRAFLTSREPRGSRPVPRGGQGSL